MSSNRVYASRSYCSECAHRNICRYRDQVEAFEANYKTNGTGLGPKIQLKVICSDKLVLKD